MTVEWDADLEHPLAKLRIPVVKTFYPRWMYEVALVINESELVWDKTLEPTEDEAEVIANYIAYRLSYYNESYRASKGDRPFDADGSTNSVILAKTENSWVYRRHSWTMGPSYVPSTYYVEKGQDSYVSTNKAGLIQLLDRVNGWKTKEGDYEVYISWNEWKQANPHIYG